MLRKKPRTKKVRKPRPIAPPKPERPSRGELKRIYKHYLTSDIGQRLNVLKRVLDWYDKAYVYVKYKLDTSNRKFTRGQLAALKLMYTARSKAIQLHSPKDKLHMYTEAVQAYERALKGLKTPTFARVNYAFSRKEKKLTVRRTKLTDKFDRFIVLLQDMLQPVTAEGKKLRLQVDRLNAPYSLDAEGHLTFDRKLVVSLKKTARKKGMLVSVQQLLPVLSDAAASEPEIDNLGYKTGRRIPNPQKRYQAVLMLLNNFISYCHRPDGPHTLVRREKEKV